MANLTNSTIAPTTKSPIQKTATFAVTNTETSLVVFGFIVTMLLTFFGNILVLMVLYRQRLIKNIRVTNSFLANLALIDLLMAILVLPFSISTSIEHKWLFSDAFCDFNGMITVFVGSASILTMAAISIDRHQAVASVGRKRLKFKQAIIMITTLEIWSFLIALLPVIGWSSYSWGLGSSVCKFSFTEETGFVFLLIISNFLIPFITMLFCYIRVFVVLRRHQKQLRQWKDNAMTGNRKDQAKSMKREGRATLIVFIVLSVFCLCWVPYVAISFIKLIKPKANVPSGAYLFSGWMTTAHAAANPIIYITLNKKFRAEVARILPCARCCLVKIGPLDDEQSEAPGARSVFVKENRITPPEV